MAITIHFISLGCAKNVVNCEQMMELCREAGYELREDPVGCDVAVINTCGFLSSASEEAIENILRMAELKKAGQLKKILVTGCMTQRYQEEVPKELPEVDGILGTGSYKDIVSAVEEVMAGGSPRCFDDINAPVDEFGRVITTPPGMPTCGSLRAVTTGAPSASFPSFGAATAAAPWTRCWRRQRHWRTVA